MEKDAMRGERDCPAGPPACCPLRVVTGLLRDIAHEQEWEWDERSSGREDEGHARRAHGQYTLGLVLAYLDLTFCPLTAVRPVNEQLDVLVGTLSPSHQAAMRAATCPLCQRHGDGRVC
jgi:hypothetical protein